MDPCCDSPNVLHVGRVGTREILWGFPDRNQRVSQGNHKHIERSLCPEVGSHIEFSRQIQRKEGDYQTLGDQVPTVARGFGKTLKPGSGSIRSFG